MSVVTNAILSFDGCDIENVSEADINRFFGETRGFVSCDNENWYGGTKYLETPLYIAAFNHFNYKEFVLYLSTLPFKYPENVQLIIKGQEDDTFKIIRIVNSNND